MKLNFTCIHTMSIRKNCQGYSDLTHLSTFEGGLAVNKKLGFPLQFSPNCQAPKTNADSSQEIIRLCIDYCPSFQRVAADIASKECPQGKQMRAQEVVLQTVDARFAAR